MNSSTMPCLAGPASCWTIARRNSLLSGPVVRPVIGLVYDAPGAASRRIMLLSKASREPLLATNFRFATPLKMLAKSISVETLFAHGACGPPGCGQPKYISVCVSPRLWPRAVTFAGPYLPSGESSVRLCDSHIIVGSASASGAEPDFVLGAPGWRQLVSEICAGVPVVGWTQESVVPFIVALPLSTSMSV